MSNKRTPPEIIRRSQQVQVSVTRTGLTCVKLINPYLQIQSLDPFLHLRLAAADFVAVDGESVLHSGVGPGFLDVGDCGSQAAAFVGHKRNDGLAAEVVVLEEGEHYLGIGAPPDGAADEDGIVLGNVDIALVGRQFTVIGLFFGNLDEERPLQSKIRSY